MKYRKIGGNKSYHWLEVKAEESNGKLTLDGYLLLQGKKYPIDYSEKIKKGIIFLCRDGKVEHNPKKSVLTHLAIIDDDITILQSIARCPRCREEIKPDGDYCKGCRDEYEVAKRYAQNRIEGAELYNKFGAAIAEAEKWTALNQSEKTKEHYKRAPGVREAKEKLEKITEKDKALLASLEEKKKETLERYQRNVRQRIG